MTYSCDTPFFSPQLYGVTAQGLFAVLSPIQHHKVEIHEIHLNSSVDGVYDSTDIMMTLIQYSKTLQIIQTRSGNLT